MWDNVIKGAPQGFDDSFLQWLHQQEEQLLITFADWYPSAAEQVQWYSEQIGQSVPEALRFYYSKAYPFNFHRDGWQKWLARMQEYRAVWFQTLVQQLDIAPDAAEAQLEASPPVWPIDCLSKKADQVGFIWKNDQIAIIQLDRVSGGGTPISVGLRYYFLRAVLMEVLAEEDSGMDFDRLGQHPRIIEISGWPTKGPQPRHVALTLGDLNP